MTIYILLFRGVGGATQLPVARLREALGEAGFENVATYINSGNAVLKSELSRERMIAKVGDICRKEFAFEKRIFAPTLEEWRKVIEQNPFADVEKGNLVHAALLAERPKSESVNRLKELAVNGDRFEVVGDVAYLHTPNGVSNSKLGERFDKWIGVENTARNWNTTRKLLELAEKARG
ncbi:MULTISPECIES: DUF1697 domain-containing protein [Mesorhizobium]|uniref:DUF1697 domain-containing protein n=1 Tax=Mesorhizobium denitrificans TaxID=2294114 RepID=A0A371X8K9_9HYPH|nr:MULTISPECIES: DUF1697 domain-containing protein [Mesorhizobium]RFC65563.1 DUF1697 domain-containing protein [Mesorhizobium denitrificans]